MLKCSTQQQKLLRTNKQIKQNCRIQSEHSNQWHFSTVKTNNSIRKTKSNSIFNSIRNKILKKKLNPGGKSLLRRNYKVSLEEVKEGTSTWKHTLCLRSAIFNIVKVMIPYKVIYRFNSVIIKIPMSF